MRIPHGRDLLDLADAGAGLGTTRRAIVLLAASQPDLTVDQAAALDLGTFESRLLDLCEAWMGPRLAARARCPACRTPLDIELETGRLRQDPIPATPEPLRIELAAARLTIRLPTGGDLALVEALGDDTAARDTLLRRCVVHIDSASGGAEVLNSAALDRVSDALADALPQANVSIGLVCAACGHGWEALLDLGTFLWRDLGYRAACLLQEVHVLASAYHWSEDAILALSPARRRRYIDLV